METDTHIHTHTQTKYRNPRCACARRGLMKGDVRMSPHEKRGTRGCLHQNRNSFITPSLHLCVIILLVDKVLIAILIHKQQIATHQKETKCRDGVMNEFLLYCRHPLVPFLFQEVTSLHPPSFQRNDFSLLFGAKPFMCRYC